MPVSAVFSSEFNDALQRLSAEDQRRVLEAHLRYMRDPDKPSPGLRVKRMKLAHVLEIRAGQDLRIIAKRDGSYVHFLYVDHHDKALGAAENGRISSTMEKITPLHLPPEVSVLLADAKPAATGLRKGPLADLTDHDLRTQFGVPEDWIATLRSLPSLEAFLAQNFEDVLTEDAFMTLAALFPERKAISTAAAPTFRIVDETLVRRFLEGEVAELQYNLPPDSWALIERKTQGPVLVRGGPGSGKTLVLLYRALHLIETPNLLAAPRVLYATFTKQLTADARAKVERLRGAIPPTLTIATIDSVAQALAGGATVYDAKFLEEAVCGAMADLKVSSLDPAFVAAEIKDVIEWRGVLDVATYRTLRRVGRGAALGTAARATIWAIHEAVRTRLAQTGRRTVGAMRQAALEATVELDDEKKYDFVLVDEVQDLSTPALGMLVALAKGAGRRRDVMLVGDGGQSIYNRGFRWADVGLRFGGANVVTLPTSERSTRQIIAFASHLIGGISAEADIDTAKPSSLEGDLPILLRGFHEREDQRDWLASDILSRLEKGESPRTFAAIVRTSKELDRVHEALVRANVPAVKQHEADFYRKNAVRVITANSAKGLEFINVYLVGVDDGTYPVHRPAADDDERRATIAQEATLLYVAATRARRTLTVLTGRYPSPFLKDADRAAVCRSLTAPPLSDGTIHED